MTPSTRGAPPRYKNRAEIEHLIDAYFKACEGVMWTYKNGKIRTDKFGNPIWMGRKPPTVTGLALALGFTTRQALLNYEAKPEFVDTIRRAKAAIERYAEERLFDRDGQRGAEFSLRCNFGWRDDPKEASMQVALEKAQELLGGVPSAI